MDGQLGELGLEILWHNKTYICMFNEKEKDLGGLLVGDNPLNHSFPVFLVLVALCQITSQVIYLLLKPLRQPKFVCSLLAGIFLGPTVLGRTKSYLRMMFSTRQKILLDVTSNLGVIYFLFLTMVKMDTSRTLRSSKSAWGIGIACMVLPLLFVCCLLVWGGKTLLSQMHSNAPLMIATFTLSRFPNVAHVLDELNLLSSDLGQLSLSASAVNDIFALTAALLGMIIRSGNLLQSFLILLSAVFVISFTFFMVRPILFYIISETPDGRPVDEIHISGILLGAMFMAAFTDSIGLFLSGSILLGLVIPNGPPLAATLVDKSEVFIMEFLMPLFYLYVGIHTDISSLKDWKGAFILMLLAILTAFLKLMGAFLPATMYYNIRVQHAFVLGLILNFRGVIEIIVIRRWREGMVIDEEGHTAMVLANLLITAIIVPMIELLYKPQDNVSAFVAKDLTAIQKSSHGRELRVLSCIHEEENVNSTITLLEASNPTSSSPICASIAHLAELAGRAAPIVIPYSKNKKMIRSYSSDRIMRVFDNYSRSSDGRVLVKPFTIISSYKSMHENICKLARDQAAHIIIIPFRKRKDDDVREVTSLRSLNTNVQAFAQSTVGILVDNGFPRYTRQTKFSYNVAVVFLGGPDDREALAFAARILGREGIHMTMIQIILNHGSYEDDDEGQEKLDASILEEFKMTDSKQTRVTYRAIVAEDGIEVINIIKSLELDCDLLILGRRPMSRSLFSEGMIHFSENPELGVIGDLLVSNDCRGHATSILVMQHCSCRENSWA
ncbi:cation/H(+) antiporter 15-like [Punica granatum]|uniref:Uncharacterized protein n=2 Tax=Punica granatum TaxID=22663 RepID=A0A218XRU6_PUNGR|nr:cation/H(+) antiporter 15-like [Punica granatum]OWM87386.1 hypothetical protein CDL15_Pgr022497 [Punica granatum]PKI31802.1 hypothetical protein CRG98_047805 [Punica granatum]